MAAPTSLWTNPDLISQLNPFLGDDPKLLAVSRACYGTPHDREQRLTHLYQSYAKNAGWGSSVALDREFGIAPENPIQAKVQYIWNRCTETFRNFPIQRQELLYRCIGKPNLQLSDFRWVLALDIYNKLQTARAPIEGNTPEEQLRWVYLNMNKAREKIILLNKESFIRNLPGGSQFLQNKGPLAERLEYIRQNEPAILDWIRSTPAIQDLEEYTFPVIAIPMTPSRRPDPSKFNELAPWILSMSNLREVNFRGSSYTLNVNIQNSRPVGYEIIYRA